MKKQDIKALHQKTTSELTQMIKVARFNIRTASLEKSRGKEKNLRSVSTKHDDLARMLTILSEKLFKEKQA